MGQSVGLATRGPLLRRLRVRDYLVVALCALAMPVAGSSEAAELRVQENRADSYDAAALDLLRLTVSQLRNDELDAAVLTLERFVQLSPNQPVEHFLRAWVAMRKGDLDAASVHLRLLLDAAPSHPHALLFHGIVSYLRGDLSIADDTLTRVLVADPHNSALVKLVAMTRLRLSEPRRAAALLDRFVAEDMLDALGLAILATAELRQGKLMTAYARFEQSAAKHVSGTLAEDPLTVSIDAGEGQALHIDIVLEDELIQRDVLMVLVHLHDGDIDKALAASQALRNGPSKGPFPDHLTGLAHLYRGAPELAQEHFHLALAIAPEFVPARLGLAQAARASGQWEEAKLAYSEILQQQPDRLDALLAMADLAAQAGDETAAEGWLREAARHHPVATEVLVPLVERLLRRERAAEALALITRLDNAALQHPELLRLHGMARLQAGDFAGSVVTLQQLSQRQSDSIEAWFQLARAQAAVGDTESARQSLEQAIALDSAHKVPMVWLALAEFELQQGRYAAALAVVARIRQVFPQEVAAMDIAANAYRGLGDDTKALVSEEQALEVDYTSDRVARVAQLLASSGEVDRGRQVLRGWLLERDDDAAVWTTLGTIEQTAGQHEAAVFAYEQAIRHGESTARVQAALAALYLSRDPQRAWSLARAAFERMPWDAAVVSVYAHALREAGGTEEGLALLNQAALIAPADADVVLGLAEALIDDGHFEQAEVALGQIQRDHPDTPQAATARLLKQRLAL